MSDQPPVLVVDDDEALREFLARALKVDGYPVHTAASATDALALLEGRQVAVVVADIFLKGVNGLELLKRVAERSPTTQVLLLGRDTPTYTVVNAMKQGAVDFVEKPIDVDYFLLCVRRAVERFQLVQENVTLRRLSDLHAERDGMVAESPGMLEVTKTIALVAPSDLTVLVTGESGVGKELVANRIHTMSPRRERPFVAVNCGAIQEALLESELFGHMRGAFTGATQDRPGLFELADGGTLFLDEIGEMNLDLQVKLLRVLEQRELRRVGGTKMVHVDVRVVAATNKRLPEQIAAGRFREDLYYRLAVVHVDVPPLRERRGDIPALVRAFLDAHHKKGLPRRMISADAVAALEAYGWPGNVRELRNIIERSLILCRGEVITEEDLPALVRAGGGPEAGPAARPGRPGPQDDDATLPLAEVERRHILRALAQNGGNKVRTARALGINVKTLYNKLKSYEAGTGALGGDGDGDEAAFP
jgi:DNA-binding NtrC family response regulator